MSQEPHIAKADIEYNLLSKIIHDVRGPFNGLIGFSDLLLNAQNTADKDAYSLIVFQLANKSYLFLQLLITWIKLVSNNYNANTTVVSADFLVHQAIKFNENEIGGKAINLHTEIIDKSVQADQVYVPIAIGIIINQMIRFAQPNDEISILSDNHKCQIQYNGLNNAVAAIFSESKSNIDTYTEKTYPLWVAFQILSMQQFLHSPSIEVVENQASYSFLWA